MVFTDIHVDSSGFIPGHVYLYGIQDNKTAASENVHLSVSFLKKNPGEQAPDPLANGRGGALLSRDHFATASFDTFACHPALTQIMDLSVHIDRLSETLNLLTLTYRNDSV